MEDSFYKHHIFICTNNKQHKICCGKSEIVNDFLKELKFQISSLKLTGRDGVRVTSSGCLGRCNDGPVAVIYPQGKWFNIESVEDREIVKNFITSLSISKNSLL